MCGLSGGGQVLVPDFYSDVTEVSVAELSAFDEVSEPHTGRQAVREGGGTV